MKDEIQKIPIDQIRILNPRYRDKRKFELIVQSIKNLGLKKPIQVSIRSTKEEEGPGYDLVCGQGRIEAYLALGYKEIPALIVEVSKEDRLLRSLAENMARRFAKPAALLHEIERLKEQGYTNVAIGQKLDICDSMVGGFLALKKAGEERLLAAALNGSIPMGIAIAIAKTESVEDQRALLKAYETKQLNYVSIRVVKRLIDQRRFFGKERRSENRSAAKVRTSAEGLVNAYRRESQRQKLFVKKAKVCEAKLVFLVTAFNKLLADENFVNLLRAESLSTMPKYLAEKFTCKTQEAA